MKVVLGWLREFCPTELSADELAETLTAAGVKVEEVLWPWEGLDGVIAARVLEVRDHPGSDTLCLARVSTGAAERDVVVGVRNMVPGDVVPYAGPGARVPALPEPLGERTIRGERSEGMLCSPRELAVSDLHEGILVLDGSVEPGADIKATFGLSDAVFDVEIEPNRPDLMSVIGVAREAATATGVPFVPPAPVVHEAAEAAGAAADLEVRDAQRCPLYLARVLRGARSAPSPVAVQARLTASGMRPVSNVVDATNYAMLELGQPLHAFDLAKLAGPGIVVRRAAEGEGLTTLDGIDRVLTEEDLVIADHERGVAVAGVMGSAIAEVDGSTVDVLLESASFAPRPILRTARRLGLTTEASARFERGADPEAVSVAADRAAELIAGWAGGEVLAGVVEAGSVPPRSEVTIRAGRAARVLGIRIGPDDVDRSLGRLIDVGVRTEDDVTTVLVPGYRIDLNLEEDLIEEVARVRGYDTIPATVPTIRQAGGVPPAYAFRDRLRDLCVRAGLREVKLLSFASPDDVALVGDDADAVRIANPLSAEEGLLRTRLLPGLLRTAARNAARGVHAIEIFEVGTVFSVGGDEPDSEPAPGPGAGSGPGPSQQRGSASPVRERRHVAFLLTGPADPGWHGDEREADYFDAKGALEALLDGLGIAGARVDGEAGEPWHPGRSAAVRVGDDRLGALGELHPRVVEAAGLSGRVAACELDAERLALLAPADLSLREVPRFPPIRRDLAFVLDASVPAHAIREAIVASGGPLLQGVTLFDVFTGGQIPEGRRSLAFALEFRAPDRTLTDQEADAAVGEVVSRVAGSFGAELRSG